VSKRHRAPGPHVSCECSVRNAFRAGRTHPPEVRPRFAASVPRGVLRIYAIRAIESSRSEFGIIDACSRCSESSCRYRRIWQGLCLSPSGGNAPWPRRSRCGTGSPPYTWNAARSRGASIQLHVSDSHCSCSPTGPAKRRSALVDLLAPTRPGNHCLRFLRSSNRRDPDALRIRGHRVRPSSPGSRQRHRTSDGRLDTAAAARYQYLLHDRDGIFAAHLDESVSRLGVEVLKSPPRRPKTNAIGERVIGTIRRECLDWFIPLSESHLRSILRTWVGLYNAGRPHMALGYGVPDPASAVATINRLKSRHRRGERYFVRAK